jgi:hypothetical protein
MSFADLIARADRIAQRVLGGVPVIYHPASGAPVTVPGIFDAQYVLVEGPTDAGTDIGVESRVPAVFLRLSDLPVDPLQDKPILTIGGTDYRVRKRIPDGIGGITLALWVV